MEPVKTGINPAFPPIASLFPSDARPFRLHAFIGAPTTLAATVTVLEFFLDELRRARSRKRDSRQKIKRLGAGNLAFNASVPGLPASLSKFSDLRQGLIYVPQNQIFHPKILP